MLRLSGLIFALGVWSASLSPAIAEHPSRGETVVRESVEADSTPAADLGEAREPRTEPKHPGAKRKRDLGQLLLLWILQAHPLQ